MEDIMRHYHIDIPARQYDKAMILRTRFIDESIKKSIYQIAKDHGIQDIYVLNESEIVKALKQYMSNEKTTTTTTIKIAALEHENKQLKDEIMCKDTTLNNALAVIRRADEKHKREVEELKSQIESLENDVRARDSIIDALLSQLGGTHVGVPQEETAAEKYKPDCGYYSEGRCKGQKMMPDCTPYAGYCPVAQRDSISSNEL